MSRKPMWRPRPSTSMTSGISLVVVAIAAITVSRSFDGFVQGLLSGGGIMLALIGVAVLSPLLRRRHRRPTDEADATGKATPDQLPTGEEKSDTGWLPSRDSRP